MDDGLTLWFTDIPRLDTRTRGCTASGSRAARGTASTAPSEKGRAGRRPVRTEPPTADATSYLENTEGKDKWWWLVTGTHQVQVWDTHSNDFDLIQTHPYDRKSSAADSERHQ